MKIAILNDVQAGQPLAFAGEIKASSHLAEEKLPALIRHIITQHQPDLLVNIGDLIRSEEKTIDLTRYERVIALFQNLNLPVIHMLGNHELKKMSALDVETIWQNAGFAQVSFGKQTFQNMNVVWLGLEVDAHNPKLYRLPHEQLIWLENMLIENQQPTLIFTHCPIDYHDVTGNFYYHQLNGNKTSLFLENAESIKKIILEAGCVIGVIQAHLHYFHVKMIGKVPFITCPAMGDNIYGQVENVIPEIYTILNITPESLMVKAFAKEYCYSGYEVVKLFN